MKHRIWLNEDSDLRSERRSDNDAPVIKGYAAVFNKWADIGGWFREKIRPGAFKKTIKEADVRALLNHDTNYVLGRNKAGTLRLKEDKKGLAIEIDPPDNQWGNDLLVSMKRGDINQMSFGFEVVKEEWNSDTQERELVEVRLIDVSVVAMPAYDQTSAYVRSALDIPEECSKNLDLLTGLFFRASREGYEITDTDRKTLESHIELCRSYLPQPEPAPNGDHSGDDDEPGDHSHESERDDGNVERIYNARWRQLELIESEI
jgi:HK97 family phage prohead protease